MSNPNFSSIIMTSSFFLGYLKLEGTIITKYNLWINEQFSAITKL